MTQNSIILKTARLKRNYKRAKLSTNRVKDDWKGCGCTNIRGHIDFASTYFTATGRSKITYRFRQYQFHP